MVSRLLSLFFASKNRFRRCFVGVGNRQLAACKACRWIRSGKSVHGSRHYLLPEDNRVTTSTWQCDRHPVLIAGPPVDDGGKSKLSWKEDCFFEDKIYMDLWFGYHYFLLIIINSPVFSHFSTITHLQLLSSLQLSGNARRGN